MGRGKGEQEGMYSLLVDGDIVLAVVRDRELDNAVIVDEVEESNSVGMDVNL